MVQQTKTIEKHSVKPATSRRRHHPVIITVVIVIVLVVIGLGLYFIFFNKPKEITPASDPDTSTTVASQDDQGSPSSSSHSENAIESEKNISQYEGTDPNSSETITGFVNFASIVDDRLEIRITISQQLSSAICYLSLTSPSGRQITEQVAATSGPTTSYCSFNPAVQSLGGESGTWAISVNVSGDSKSGTISGETEVKI